MNNTRSPGTAARALLIGGGAHEAERMAALVDGEASILCFAPDRVVGDAVRDAIRLQRPHASIGVMLGDPALLVHKVSGPFDVILDAHPAADGRRNRLRALLAEGGKLYG